MKYNWLNKKARIFLENGYLQEGDTAESKIELIAKAFGERKGKAYQEKFLEYMDKGWFLLSSPVWANFGTNRGLPISCFNSHIEDTMESILGGVAEVGMMTKHGGGTSGYFGDVRHRGADISTGGKSDGAVHFMQLFESVTNICKQSSVRRGAMACYLPIDHKDVKEFLNIKHEGSPIQFLFNAVTVSDAWMESMIGGDSEKREIWAKVIKSRSETGLPYVMFSDNANNNAPQVYKDKGLKINASNLCCVTGDQRVPTTKGLLTAKELFEDGSELVLTDGVGNTVKSSPMQFVKRDKVLRLSLSNGMTHTVTLDHKLPIKNERTEGIKKASEVKVGDKARIQKKKGVFGQVDKQKEAFLLGMYQSDGTQYKDFIFFDVWENDFDLLDEIQESHDYVCDRYQTQHNSRYPNPKFVDCTVNTGTVQKKRLGGKACKKALNFEKGYVPQWIWEANEETQWQYVRGLLYADGTVHVSSSHGSPIQIAYADINREFLEELQILFTNLGLSSSIHILRKAGETLLPDGKGGSKFYDTKDCWRLIIGNKNDAQELERHTGFLSRKGIQLEEKEYRDNTKKYFEVVEIEELEEEDTYCVSVDSEDHLWVCNGVVTHNSEIMLSSTPEESFVCCLSSMNLLHYDEWKDTDAVEVMAYFLDAVLDEFIEKASEVPYMERAVRFSRNQRAIGIGATGWHSLLQSKGIPFESMEAKMLNAEVFRNMSEASLEASKKAAVELGEPPLLEGYGERWTTRHAIAPNTSSAFILGQVSQSIEPFKSNYYVKDLAKFKASIKNEYLEKVLDNYGKNDDNTWNSILRNNGSVQQLDFLTEKEKDTFRTFAEISAKETVIQAAQRQKSIDQGQSLNLTIPPDTSAKDINELMIFAWEQGIKSLYYQHSTNAAQAFYRKLNECTNCEG